MRRIYGLDLFCGGGGATGGYRRAAQRLGIDLVMYGVDHHPHQKSYLKVGDHFVRRDALEVLNDNSFMGIFDFVHLSPPCQKFSSLSRMVKNTSGQVDYITPAREYFDKFNTAWVMENVEGAPLQDPLLLCGSMFEGLVGDDPRRQLRRHRLFEIHGADVPALGCQHNGFKSIGVYGTMGQKPPSGSDVATSLAEGRKLMGVDWRMTWRELREAIPPPYTEYIGMHLLREVSV